MLRALGLGFIVSACVLVASVSSAQQTLSAIAGAVKDSTGKPIAGATVEAASPALIERVRSVVTNGEGQYKITDLQPGTYSVTFKAPGFTTFKNDGVELTGGFTGTVNATLRAGNATEIITVTGSTTQIDTRTTAQQNVVTSETASSGRDATAAVSVTRGLSQATTDVGGAAGAYSAQGNSLTVRGKAGVKRLFDGLRVENAEGIGNTSYMINSATVEQTVVETGGGSAESLSAGGSINNVPKSGSNNYQFRVSGLVSKEGMQSDNLDGALRARGLTSVQKVGNIWDITATAGGPIMKDKLWFFVAPKMWGNRNYAGGIFWNDTQSTPFYTPANGTGIDIFGVRRTIAGLPVRRADQFEVSRSNPFRLTWQATRRDKVNFFVDFPEAACTCRGLAQTTSPEAIGGYIFGRKGHLWQLGLFQGTWSSPRTNRLLMEGGISFAFGGFPQVYQPTTTPDTISIIDTGLGFTWNDKQGPHRGLATNPDNVSDRLSERFTTSYITGSHAMKLGISVEHVWHESFNYTNHDINYTFNNGVPNRVTEYSTPYTDFAKVKAELAVFAQDQWTIKRLTLNYGVRYSYFNAGIPPQSAAPTRFVPFGRTYDSVSCVPCWSDLDPRVGAAYDTFGNGKTALKGSFGRYVNQQVVAIPTANNPFNTSVNSVTRTWNDTFFGASDPRSGNYIPDCDLTNPLLNGECGQISDLNFGLSNPKATRYAADVINGFGIRPYVWDSSIEIQHQLTRAVTLTGGYYRNWAANFSATDNTLVSPGDYSPFCITTPIDPGLPGGGGQQLCGLYDISVAKFGQVTNVITQASHYGKQTAVNDFLGFSINARLPRNVRLGANVDAGRTVTDVCFVVNSPSQLIYDLGGSTGTSAASPTYCHSVTPFSGNLAVKLNGAYPLPYGFNVTANYQNASGAQRLAIWNAPNGAIAPSLGRNLAACGTRAVCTATFAVPVIQPGTSYEARRNQLDLRLGKSLRLRPKLRFTGDLGVYNVLNNNAITAVQTAFGPQWLRPNTVLYARLLQVSARLDF